MPPASPLQLEYVREPAVSDALDHEPRALIPTGGVAELCVDESHRRQGLVKPMLELAHERLRASGIEFSLLVGEAAIDFSNGDLPLSIEMRWLEPSSAAFYNGQRPALYKTLSKRAWPSGPVDLRGPLF